MVSGARVIAKIVFLALCAAATGASLLSVRQQRVQAAHEMATLHERIAQREESLAKLRLAIAGRLTPGHIRSLVAALEASRDDELEPVRFEWCAPRRWRVTTHEPTQRAAMLDRQGEAG